ncbi:outer membrane protein [Azorhizobium doebereinerae]|uniref:outer membrane protein n=1 Tax=Azorhizobium doebereinerae TaxID=281091 RepID=UPI00040977D9|nr:outer membrane protein [Azorhizobium doebereinerae]
MKRLLLSTAIASTAIVTSAIALAIAAPASAADLATRYPVKAPIVPVVPVFSWTGFYIGANAGFGGDKYEYAFGGVASPLGLGSASADSSGFFAGGQAGYNYQFANNIVLGLETDIQWSGIEGDVTLTTPGATTNLKSSLDYFGTVRGRLGYAFDRFLPYVTGGFAYGESKTSISQLTPTSLYSGEGSGVKTGWTVGGGLEYALTNNWTFKTEYLYVDLGDSDYGSALTGSTVSVDNKFHTVKAGINYKF